MTAQTIGGELDVVKRSDEYCGGKNNIPCMNTLQKMIQIRQIR